MSEVHKRKVRMGSELFLYRAKAPFVESGASVFGALELDQTEDKVCCHECGRWFKMLGPHIHWKHGLTVRAYKLKHGLTQQTSLINEGTREKLSASIRSRPNPNGIRDFLPMARMASIRNGRGKGVRHQSAERRNKRRRCPAQILFDLRELADKLGHTPSGPEMQAIGLSHQTLKDTFSGESVISIMSLAGLQPRHQGQQFSTDVLKEIIRDFYVRFGRLPSAKDLTRRSLPAWSTFKRHFGSLRKAYAAAGFGLIIKRVA